MNQKADVLNHINALDDWVSSRNWSGFDPYQKTEFIINAKYKRLATWVVSIANSERKLRLLGIQPFVNTKGIALFLCAYSSLYKSTGSIDYRKKAMHCADMLIALNNARTGNHKLWGWGYPFEWQSRILFKPYIPYATIAVPAGLGLFQLYNQTRDERLLTYCNQICEHFLNDYYIDTSVGKDAVCFSYSPIDKYHIHNANLAIGEFFSVMAKETGNRDYFDYAIRIANYAIAEMEINGSLNYWGKDQTDKFQQDIYHCGFEVRHLMGIGERCQSDAAIHAAKRRYAFMIDAFSDERCIPYRNPNSERLIDIHGCAEFLLTNARMSSIDPMAKDRLIKGYQWIIQNMLKCDGSFIYQISNYHRKPKKDKTPYIRWGQAWMLFALAETYTAISEKTTQSD